MLRKFLFCFVVVLKDTFLRSGYLIFVCVVSHLVNKRNRPYDLRSNFLLERLDGCMFWTIALPSVYSLWTTAVEHETLNDLAGKELEERFVGTFLLYGGGVIVWARFACFLVTSVLYDFFIFPWQKIDSLCPEVLSSRQRFVLRFVTQPGLLTLNLDTNSFDLSKLSYSERMSLSKAMQDLSMVYMHTIEAFSSPENALYYSSYLCVGALRMSYRTCVHNRKKLAKKLRHSYTVKQHFQKGVKRRTGTTVGDPNGVTVTEMEVALLKAYSEIGSGNELFFFSPSKACSASNSPKKVARKLTWTNQSGVVDFLNQLEKNGMIQLQRHVEDEGQGDTEPLAGQSVEQTLASLGLSPAQPKEECAVSELFQKTVALVEEIAQLRLEVEQLENKRMNKPAMWELPLLEEESSLSTSQHVFDVFEVDMVDLQDYSTYLVTDQHQELHHGQDFQPEVLAAASLVAVPQELHSGQDDNPPPPVAVLEASLGQGHSTSDFSRGDVVLAVADTPAATVPKGDPYLRQSAGGSMQPRPKRTTLSRGEMQPRPKRTPSRVKPRVNE